MDEEDASLLKLAKYFVLGVLVTIPFLVGVIRHERKKPLQYDWYIPTIEDDDSR